MEQELRDKGDLDDERKSDISLGMEAASSVLHRTNAAIDREERDEAVQELKERVQDWKGHRFEKFGDLLLYGTYTVLKGDSGAKDAEREVRSFSRFFSHANRCGGSTRSTSSRRSSSAARR